MRPLALCCLLIAVIAAQVAWWPQLTIRVMPALALATILAWTFAKGLKAGFIGGLIAGLLLDLYAQITFGRFTVGILLALAVVAVATRGDYQDLSPEYKVLTVLAAAAAYELWLVLVTWLSTDGFPFFAELVGVATLNSAATTGAFLVFAPVARLIAGSLYAPHERSI